MTVKVALFCGGGGGASVTKALMHLKDSGLDIDVAAIVTPFDSAGNSGAMRPQTAGICIGDAGRILSAMLMTNLGKVLETRRKDRSTIRNQLIAGFFEDFSDPREAMREVHASFGPILRGRVIPTSYTDSHIHVRLRKSGRVLVGEGAIYKADLVSEGGIQELWLSPAPEPNADAIDAIEKADYLIFCPGSVPCSLAPTALVLRDALLASTSRKLCIANLMGRPRHAEPNATATDHVMDLETYLCPGFFDTVIYNTARFPDDVLEQYKLEHKGPAYGTDEAAEGRLMIGAKLVNGHSFPKPDPNDALGELRGASHDYELLSTALALVLR